MIDYEQFFFELRDLYLANGLEFRHELNDVKQSISCSRHVGILTDIKLDKDLFGEEKLPKDSFKPTNKFQNGIKIDNNKLFNKAMWRFCKSFEEFVYSKAYELAEKIGRLPDAMHSRMILSTDDSPSLKKYVMQFG